MSFDQNNDYKNTTLDNDISMREKSNDKNNDSLSVSAIAKSLKSNNPLKEKNISNNENYLIKKSANKKFETIKEEDEYKNGKKRPSYLNYYTKNSKEQKNHLITYNADSVNNTYKKISKKIDSNHFDQYLTTKKNVTTEQNQNIRKESVSPSFKVSPFSSRVNNNNKGNINTTITEVTASSTFNKQRKTINHRNSINIPNNNYTTLNKSEVKDYAKKIRQKNISVPNAQKYLGINTTTIKMKNKLNTTLLKNKQNEKDKIEKEKVRSNLLYSFKSPIKGSVSATKTKNNTNKSDIGNKIVNKDVKKMKLLLPNNKEKFYKEKSVNKSCVKDSSFINTLITEETHGKESIINKKGSRNINSANILSYNFMHKGSLSSTTKGSKSKFEINGNYNNKFFLILFQINF